MPSERRASLLALKLQTLVRDHTGLGTAVPDPFPGGAALACGDEAWVLVEDAPDRGLGGAMAWAERRGATSINVLVEQAAGLVARRAQLFEPPPTVWTVDGRELHVAAPEPHPVAPALPAAVVSLRAVIEACGAEAVEEHGVLTGEVAGLEVCRAVVGEDGTARLEVGIGARDRETFQLVHGGGPLEPPLTALVENVAAHRTPDAPPHALDRVARERYLRWRLAGDPGLVGLAAVVPAPPPVPRTNLKDPVPCVALGTDGDASTVVVVCSTGIDLDLVPFAADARSALAAPDMRLILAVPQGDDHPITRRLAARLASPAGIVPVAAR